MINKDDPKSVLRLKLTQASQEKPLKLGVFSYMYNQNATGEEIWIGDVEDMVWELRAEGYLVVCDTEGYWVARSYAEWNVWRDEYLIKDMIRLFNTFTAMSKTAGLLKLNAARAKLAEKEQSDAESI